jgi:hypothetical protein
VKIHTVAAVVGVLAMLAGCADDVSGEPSSGGDPSASPTGETSDPKYADLLPPRPRELDLTGVDPCADLLTDQQLRELDYDLGYARPPLPGKSNIHGGPDCTFASNGGAGGSDRNVSSLVGISTTEGASTWVTDPAREPDTRPEVADIEGFSALVLPNPRFPDDCLVVVDTAEGQYLQVSSGESTGGADDPAPFCQEAKTVAGMAIQTVSASR